MTLLASALRLPAWLTQAGGAVSEQREPWAQTEKDSLTRAVELLQGMTISSFRESGLVVVVRCAVLGEEVVWAADRTATSRVGMDDQGRVVYSGEEFRLILALAPNPSDLVSYHAMRKAIGRVHVVNITREDLAPELQTIPVAKMPKKWSAAWRP
jgi:hypothetical protein